MQIIEERYNWRPGSTFQLQTPDTIVIHHSLARVSSAQDIHQWHLARGWKGIAYQFLIRKNGLVYRGRQEHHVGGHLYGEEDANTIGICLEGCYTDYVANGIDYTEKEVPQIQMEALIGLIQDCKSRWPINLINGHLDYNSAKEEEKDCPGKYFPWDKFQQMLKREEYKSIIQTKTRFHNPQGVWDVVEKHHPFPDALYKQWADSYRV